MIRQMCSALTVVGALGCADIPSEPGEWGSVRYFANLRGEPPMRLIPPLTDRSGNTYVLYGGPEWFDTVVSRLSVEGDRPTSCDPAAGVDPGVFGLHGWVGRSIDRVWYWTGTVLVEVASSGACEFVLRNDPVSGTEIRFVGVAPLVDDTPSRRFATALIQGGTGDVNFTLIDLDRRLPFNTSPFPASDPRELRVITTGGHRAERNTVFVVAFSGQVQAFFLDRLGEVVARRDVALPTDIEAYGIPSFLQFSDAGQGAGLLPDGRLFVLSMRDSAVVQPGFAAQGLLLWEGELYVTGEDDGALVLARLEADGRLTRPLPFRSAERALEGLAGSTIVVDERSRPVRRTPWEGVRSAIGDRPLISPWPIDPYTNRSVGWLLAGPSFDTSFEPVTAIGFAPVGVEVP